MKIVIVQNMQVVGCCWEVYEKVGKLEKKQRKGDGVVRLEKVTFLSGKGYSDTVSQI